MEGLYHGYSLGDDAFFANSEVEALQEFSNCMLAESNDGMDNVKPVKSSPTANVDNVQALLSALWLYDQANGSVNK